MQQFGPLALRAAALPHIGQRRRGQDDGNLDGAHCFFGFFTCAFGGGRRRCRATRQNDRSATAATWRLRTWCRARGVAVCDAPAASSVQDPAALLQWLASRRSARARAAFRAARQSDRPSGAAARVCAAQWQTAGVGWVAARGALDSTCAQLKRRATTLLLAVGFGLGRLPNQIGVCHWRRISLISSVSYEQLFKHWWIYGRIHRGGHCSKQR